MTWRREVMTPVLRVEAQLGWAPALGAGGRRFESCLPDVTRKLATEKEKTARARLIGARSLRPWSWPRSRDSWNYKP